MPSVVTSKGEITLPDRIMQHLGIEPGSTVDFVLTEDGRVALVKLNGERPISRFERVRGTATSGMTTDEIMALMRGED